ncbi:23S rRNA (guanosine(2251)-2'-O)-methyltransferase RlmB [Rhodospira trueperi]|uniref:23S rRNA (Guanosine2251-2'-O)-methyltransferase n=1 Tax=Rhodospira trueperi TaxID=69960 RepID=A0A1G6XSP0_9PROT|nr:23S rRNA (guanosine(2251)-2'-O)-methyltransferase RlmB [Rhodospira trueperi]SDD80733.1 23S rRNA (guanosine2251-2'-O)-methyltransferase [Rhodospira trueperi]
MPRSPRAGRGHVSPSSRPRERAAGPRSDGALRLYGHHAVVAALANRNRPVRRLLTTGDATDALTRAAEARGLTVDRVQRQELDALLPPGAVHQGIVLEAAPLPAHGLEDLTATAAPDDAAVVVVLDQVSDPHNVGAILRSAAAFGALGVITQDRHAPAETGALAKAASGALERVPLIRVPNLSRALKDLRDFGFWSVGLDADAPVTLGGAALSGPLALVLGAEGAGLRRLTREHCDHLARLPMMPGAVESLNVSNACAVALYELRRESLEAFSSTERPTGSG